jgi:hypothetical protein
MSHQQNPLWPNLRRAAWAWPPKVVHASIPFIGDNFLLLAPVSRALARRRNFDLRHASPVARVQTDTILALTNTTQEFPDTEHLSC